MENEKDFVDVAKREVQRGWQAKKGLADGRDKGMENQATSFEKKVWVVEGERWGKRPVTVRA